MCCLFMEQANLRGSTSSRDETDEDLFSMYSALLDSLALLLLRCISSDGSNERERGETGLAEDLTGLQEKATLKHLVINQLLQFQQVMLSLCSRCVCVGSPLAYLL